jgi:hypothetical protein
LSLMPLPRSLAGAYPERDYAIPGAGTTKGSDPLVEAR